MQYPNYFDSIDEYLDDSSKDNNKLYWKLMKESFNIKLCNEIPPLHMNGENDVNSLAYSDTDKIKALNTYFPSMSTIDDTNVTLPNMYSLCNNNLSNIIIEEQEISDIITILPVIKAIGPDCISHKMLKSTKSSIVKPLKLFFNSSLSENMFPSVWKIARVIPLFKKEDPSLVSSYRPVYVLAK